MISFTEPGSDLLQIKNEKRRVDGHVEDTGGEGDPSFLEAPEISQTAANPRVVATFVRQGAGKLADHEGGWQAPEDRKKQQDQDSVTVTSAMNNFFRPIGAARNHKERSGNQRPERELCRFLFSC